MTFYIKEEYKDTKEIFYKPSYFKDGKWKTNEQGCICKIEIIGG
jgi:hypothetical protein